MDNYDMVNFKVCRICLQNVTDYKDLFTKDKECVEILNKIYLCFQVSLSYQSHMPTAICLICFEELNAANRFRLKCASCEDKLKSLSFVSQNESLLNLKNESHVVDDNSVLLDDFLESFSDEKIVNFKNNFMCDVCNKILKSKASLMKHNVTFHEKRKHVGKVTGVGPSRRYHCTKCSYSTPHSQTLVNHMRRHNGERPYHCECGKSFTQSSSLAAHRKTHSDTTYYTCSTCGKQFKHAFALKNHLSVHDTGTYSCNICQKCLKTKKSLRDHMFRHNNIRNYNCEDCGDTFVTSSELLNHRKKHKLERNVECHLCGFKTKTKRSLVMHIKRHAGEKEIKCDLCNVTCYTRSDLRRHLRVHTREKPFQCPKCVQRFSHSTSLNKHMHTVHGINYKWCDLIWKETGRSKCPKDEKL